MLVKMSHGAPHGLVLCYFLRRHGVRHEARLGFTENMVECCCVSHNPLQVNLQNVAFLCEVFEANLAGQWHVGSNAVSHDSRDGEVADLVGFNVLVQVLVCVDSGLEWDSDN